MEKNKLTLQIITPRKKILDEKVESVVLRTTEGNMGVLYNHEPVVALLDHNMLTYTQDGVTKKATTMGGFVEITKDKIVILTDASEFPEEIDIERAKQAKERAEKRLKDAGMDTARAEIAIKRAITRINIKETK